MEPSPPNSQNPNPQNQNFKNQQEPGTDNALRSYFLQQGQLIGKLYDMLKSNLFAFGFKTFIAVVLQIVCYLLFIFAIYIAIVIPTDLEGVVAKISGHEIISYIPYNNEYVTEFLYFIKILVGIIALPVLGCAALLGRNRRKSAKIRQAYSETELMKKNFEHAMQQFRF